jgi:hypothetical protein
LSADWKTLWTAASKPSVGTAYPIEIAVKDMIRKYVLGEYTGLYYFNGIGCDARERLR